MNATGEEHAGAQGHRDVIAQPHTRAEGEPILEAEAEAAQARSARHPLGRPGRKFDRRSPFMIGVMGAAGVATTYALIQAVLAAGQVLTLIGIALFLAIGLEPAVSWLVRPWFPRWAAVTTVFLVMVGLFAGFLAAAITPLVTQGRGLLHHAPDTVAHLGERYPLVAELNTRFQLQDRVQRTLTQNSSDVAGGVLNAGRTVFSLLTSTVIVLVLTVYFMANFPRIRASVYRLFPRERRPRAILLGDAIFAKVGGYILGNVLISLITAVLTFCWLYSFHVPYPLILAVLVAVLDLIPAVGSTLAGIIVALVALTVSLPVAIATVVFFIVLRMVEDYLLVPRIIGRTVQVPAVVTVVAVLIGGALLGITGALLAIPVAAALLVLLRETVFPSLDEERQE
ncbi:AI-2E family transporter [Nocardia yamanashiensis]|uniref:AI-2E family transporter n=1 Tax=Nocardia yamanashiensis TaxID=209247 RepID=UPI001E572FF8|nr:AI-2E family transporter [Nocardia yamanashiensis]UGT43834.1 AI-2E family transporter [Nocardia yamanashiensis]